MLHEQEPLVRPLVICTNRDQEGRTKLGLDMDWPERVDSVSDEVPWVIMALPRAAARWA